MDRSRSLTTLALLGAVWGATPLCAQWKGLQVAATLGLHQFSLSDVKDAYASLLGVYQANGFQIPVQRRFPTNLLVGVEATRQVAPAVAVGLSADYTWTHAYALYGDTTGRLDLTSTVKLTTLQGVVRVSQAGAPPVRAYVELRGGLAFSSVAFAQTVQFLAPINRQRAEVLTGRGTAPTLEGAVGVEYPLGGLRLGAAVGYRYDKISRPNGTDVVNGTIQSSGALPLDLNPSGVTVRFRIGRGG